MPIRPDRLMGDMRALAAIGRFETGVHRPAFSKDDMAARQWLRGKMDEAGLDATIDGAGNVYGRVRGRTRTVLIGSHSDTVPYGGWLDGAMGVIVGLEVARAVAEMGGKLGVDVVAFQDEEGTFLPFLGSRAFCGEDLTAEMTAATSREHVTLAEAMTAAGLSGKPAKHVDTARHAAYFEAHIEQGPRLEAEGIDIGVVTGIVGGKTARVVFRGEANHAGTTPMAMRRDAGAAALAFGAAVRRHIAAAGAADTVSNIGAIRFEPGASNVVPGLADMVVQVRDTDPAVLARLDAVIRETAQACAAEFSTTVEIVQTQDTPPAIMTPALVDLVERAAVELGATHRRMPSGAGHDAMVLSRYLPSAMLFVPSIGGRSHHVSENTADADIVRGAEVLLRAVTLFAAG